MEHDELITAEDIDPDELEEREPRQPGMGSKVFAIVCAILLFLYFSADGRVQDTIVGWTETAKRDGGRFYHENATVVFDDTVYQELQSVWDSTRRREFRVCLQGTVDDTTYRVRDLYEPAVKHSSVFHISSSPCPSDTVVDLHSHPPGRCVASGADIAHLEGIRETSPNVLLAVMCGRDRISLY